MSEIDLNLAVLDTILPRGERLYCSQIAELVGCSAQHISQIELRALAKLRRKLAKEMPEKIAARFRPKRKSSTSVEKLQKWLAELNSEVYAILPQEVRSRSSPWNVAMARILP